MKLHRCFLVCEMLSLNRKVINFSRMLTLHSPACARPYCAVYFGETLLVSGCSLPLFFLFTPRILDRFSIKFCMSREHVVHLRSPGRTVSCDRFLILFVLGLPVASVLVVYAVYLEYVFL